MRSSIASGSRPAPALIGLALAIAMLAAAMAWHGLALAQRTPIIESAPPPALLPDRTPPPTPAERIQGMSSDPRMPATATEQARRLVREGKTDDALAVLDVALQTAPKDPQLRFTRGVILADQGKSAEATAVFEALVADFPELPEPRNNLAVMYAAAGDLDKARAALEDAVRALPGYALAQENLGDIYLRMAMRAWQRAIELDPASASAGERLKLAREFLSRVAPAGTKKP